MRSWFLVSSLLAFSLPLPAEDHDHSGHDHDHGHDHAAHGHSGHDPGHGKPGAEGAARGVSSTGAKPAPTTASGPNGESCEHDHCETGSPGHSARSSHGHHSGGEGHLHPEAPAHLHVHDEIFEDCAHALEGPNLGGFLFPSLHVFGVFGGSSGDQAELAGGHHDPQRDGANLQALEPSISLLAGSVHGFVNGIGYTDAEGEFDFSLEEGYVEVVDLLLGAEIRGGQFLNRFGFQNATHVHTWKFVDGNLLNGRILNEGELITQGAEINLPVPFFGDGDSSRIALAFGGVPSHAHDHAHGEQEEGEHHHEEAPFEADGANFQDQVFSASWGHHVRINDRSSFTTIASGAWGDNAFGRQTGIYGLGVEYAWRERGSQHGGRSVRIRTEVMWRDVDAVAGHLPGESGEEDHDEEEEEEEHDEPGHYHDGDYASFDEFGISNSIVFGFNDRFEAGLRTEWVAGIEELGLEERFRISPNLTWYPSGRDNLLCRLQYNYDHGEDFGSENSVWFQVGLTLGGPHEH